MGARYDAGALDWEDPLAATPLSPALRLVHLEHIHAVGCEGPGIAEALLRKIEVPGRDPPVVVLRAVVDEEAVAAPICLTASHLPVRTRSLNEAVVQLRLLETCKVYEAGGLVRQVHWLSELDALIGIGVQHQLIHPRGVGEVDVDVHAVRAGAGGHAGADAGEDLILPLLRLRRVDDVDAVLEDVEVHPGCWHVAASALRQPAARPLQLDVEGLVHCHCEVHTHCKGRGASGQHLV
mmetsp:Transcript_35355/g.82631  ORF Transcript_35355/g.82631 Transcript_35355/m.82631 type:complete len:237 (-) Transcript_35355:1507-2217(-)